MVVRAMLVMLSILWSITMETVQADLLQVGVGDSKANLILNFLGGGEYEFEVLFDDSQIITGLDLLEIVRDSGVGFDFLTESFANEGEFVEQIEFEGQVNTGLGNEGLDWWRYWSWDPDNTDWILSLQGAGARHIEDGYTDAWVFGRHGRPIVVNPNPDVASLYPRHAIREIYYPNVSENMIDNPRATLGQPTSWFKTPSGAVFAASIVKAPRNKDLANKPVAVEVASFEVALIGTEEKVQFRQSFTIAFDDPVKNDPLNPYGIDLLLFGNAAFEADRSIQPDTDMSQVVITDASVEDPLLTVSVSPDGATWYTYTQDQLAEGFFPTQAYEWDEVNQDWGDALSYTKPVDPQLNEYDFQGLTVSEAIELYNGSAGGKGLDLADSGFDAIRFILVEAVGVDQKAIIDGFADVSPALAGDTNFDEKVDYNDFLTLQNHLGKSGDLQDGDFNGDGQIDLADLAILQSHMGMTMTPEQRYSILSFAVDASQVTIPQPHSVLSLVWMGCLTAWRRARRRGYTYPG